MASSFALCFQELVGILSIFQFCNSYVVTPKITELQKNPRLKKDFLKIIKFDEDGPDVVFKVLKKILLQTHWSKLATDRAQFVPSSCPIRCWANFRVFSVFFPCIFRVFSVYFPCILKNMKFPCIFRVLFRRFSVYYSVLLRGQFVVDSLPIRAQFDGILFLF